MHRLAYLVIAVPAVVLAQPPPADPPPDPATGSGSGSGSGSATPAPPPATPPPTPTGPSISNPPDVSAPPKAEPSEQEAEQHVNYEPIVVKPGAFLQPQYRLRQNSSVGANQNDGFRMARVRTFLNSSMKIGNVEASAYIEGELQPQFSMQFAFVTLARALPAGGRVTIDFGQVRVPITHENLISDSFLSFVDKAAVISIAPDHDLGTRLWLVPPGLKFLRVSGNVFNGEGRNQVQNINESFLYVGRLELTPFGKDPLSESYFAGDFLTFGVSVGRNKLSPSSAHHELVTYIGGDVELAFKGLSGSAEYLEVHHDFDGDVTTAPIAYHANGFYAQLAYMLPIKAPPYHQGRFEIGARVEELDRNDTVPINTPGDPNQSFRELTGVVSYYLRQHYLKIQLAGNHFTQIENMTATKTNATFPEDQLLLQVTYRME